jgi:hypothetical protein
MYKTWGGVRGNYCSAEAASLEGEGRRDKERGEEVIPQRQNGSLEKSMRKRSVLQAFIA